MSSLPVISHHLFVAAVDHERRHRLKPPHDSADEGSSTPASTPVMPTRELDLDHAVDLLSGSPLTRET